MNRNQLNYAIDVLLMLLGLAVLITGLLLAFIIPRGSGRRGVTLWGLARHDWSDVHLWLALPMVALIVLHLILHWTWVHHTTARTLGLKPKPHPHPRGSRISLAITLGLLAALIFGSLALGRVMLR